MGSAYFDWGGSRGFVLASRGSAPRTPPGVCADTPLDPAAKGFAPGPHWCAARPRPPACRSASLCLALLAPGLLASLLLKFNSAALRGISDGVFKQALSAWCGAETSDFSEKIGRLGRSPLDKLVRPRLFPLLPYSRTPLLPNPYSPIPLFPSTSVQRGPAYRIVADCS
jgi:hypothetical protein